MNLLRSSRQICVPGTYPFEERILTYFFRLSGVPFNGQVAVAGSGWSHETLNTPCSLVGRYPGQSSLINIVNGQGRMFRAMWEAYSESFNASQGKSSTYFAEKVYDDVALVNDFVYCKNIFLVRDPRDQLVSIREFDRKRGYKGFGNASEGGVDSVIYLCLSLEALIRVASEIGAGEDRRIIVRYEDLVCNQEGTLSKLGDWLSIDFDLDAFHRENSRYVASHSTVSNPEASVGRWKGMLSPDELSVFDEYLGPYMKMLGYN